MAADAMDAITAGRNNPVSLHPAFTLPIIEGMAKTTSCPLCGRRMLRYENPDRMLCPNFKAHDARLAREKSSGVSGYTSKQVPVRNKSTRRG